MVISITLPSDDLELAFDSSSNSSISNSSPSKFVSKLKKKIKNNLKISEEEANYYKKNNIYNKSFYFQM